MDALGAQVSRELAALDRDDVLHRVGERRPSACTRRAQAGLSTTPAALPPTYVLECTRHRLLAALGKAVAVPERPLLIRLSDARGHVDALRSAWERHLEACDSDTFTAATPQTEGTRCTLRQAWTGGSWNIQHDLEETLRDKHPIADFLRAHPHLALSHLWRHVEAWLEAHVGPIARRPAFINGIGTATTATHYDDYDSVALVLVGVKTFCIAPPSLVRQTGRGRLNESSAHPFVTGSPKEQAVPQPFWRVELTEGNLLFLPRGWWHFVVSDPKTMMMCAWV